MSPTTKGSHEKAVQNKALNNMFKTVWGLKYIQSKSYYTYVVNNETIVWHANNNYKINY